MRRTMPLLKPQWLKLFLRMEVLVGLGIRQKESNCLTRIVLPVTLWIEE